MKELFDLGKEQGYLEYPEVVRLLQEDHDFMDDQIEAIVQLLEDLGVEIRGKSN